MNKFDSFVKIVKIVSDLSAAMPRAMGLVNEDIHNTEEFWLHKSKEYCQGYQLRHSLFKYGLHILDWATHTIGRDKLHAQYFLGRPTRKQQRVGRVE